MNDPLESRGIKFTFCPPHSNSGHFCRILVNFTSTWLLIIVIGLPPRPVTTIAPKSAIYWLCLNVATRPPTLSLASITTTSKPKDCNCRAAVRPDTPAPNTIILGGFLMLGCGWSNRYTPILMEPYLSRNACNRRINVSSSEWKNERKNHLCLFILGSGKPAKREHRKSWNFVTQIHETKIIL